MIVLPRIIQVSFGADPGYCHVGICPISPISVGEVATWIRGQAYGTVQEVIRGGRLLRPPMRPGLILGYIPHGETIRQLPGELVGWAPRFPENWTQRHIDGWQAYVKTYPGRFDPVWYEDLLDKCLAAGALKNLGGLL